MSHYLSQLNEIQQQAAKQTDGAVMIIAGAGSGKTRVLTYRIAHLMEKGVDPFNILALTFTNKAAREMKDRIANIVGFNEARNLWMGTFHSVFSKILRVEAQRIGYPNNFTIYDTDDSKSLIKDILKEQHLDDKVYKPNLVYNRISAAKNNLISAEAYNANSTITDEDRMSGKPMLGKIYEIYAKRCFKAGAMDFDDLLFKTNILLRDFPDVLHKYQHRFKYIMVDEYQDTNFSQYVIVKQLAAAYRNICVVGDDAQSIYAFRGANIQNILNFEKDYPELKVFKLEQNYRSTKNIVNAANSVIANNREQLKKDIWTDNEEGSKIKLSRAYTDNEEGSIVASSIFETIMNMQAANSDFAILYRTNAQSRAMEEALRRMNIPYRIYGGLSFYQRKEVKDLLAYFRLTINNHDEESLKRIINYPGRGIGQTTVEKLTLAATDHDTSTWTVMENIKEFDIGIASTTREKISDFVSMIKSFTAQLFVQNAYDLGHHIANTSGLLRELYVDKTPEGVSRYENIQELLNGVKEFTDDTNSETLTNTLIDEVNETVSGEQATTNNQQAATNSLALFMQDIALLTDADKQQNDEDRNKVSLMTIHSAKGLEFPYVYIVGMEENLFPSQMSLTSRTDLEEERRLFYVALTRAEKQVNLTYAATRYRWGNLIHCEPSRFIEEIEAAYIDFPGGDIAAPKSTQSYIPEEEKVFRYDKPTSADRQAQKPAAPKQKPQVVIPKRNMVKVSQTSNVASANNEHLKTLAVGMTVEHEKFGSGKVVFMEGVYPNSKATVQFDTVGSKQLLLKFAKLKIC